VIASSGNNERTRRARVRIQLGADRESVGRVIGPRLYENRSPQTMRRAYSPDRDQLRLAHRPCLFG
jgi:hypothetical protein